MTIIKVSTFIALLSMGCTPKPTPLPTLHNYPELGRDDCPTHGREYDEEFVKKRSNELGLRTVDYLHLVNSRKMKQ
jgi:hypothetical protein